MFTKFKNWFNAKVEAALFRAATLILNELQKDMVVNTNFLLTNEDVRNPKRNEATMEVFVNGRRQSRVQNFSITVPNEFAIQNDVHLEGTTKD